MREWMEAEYDRATVAVGLQVVDETCGGIENVDSTMTNLRQSTHFRCCQQTRLVAPRVPFACVELANKCRPRQWIVQVLLGVVVVS